jgi:hypothetical protein
MHATLSLKNTGITHSVLVDVTTGELQAVEWKRGTTDALESLPVKDSIMAITDESYFDWPLLPEVPSSLQAMIVVDDVKLNWQVHGGNSVGIILERQLESRNSGRAMGENRHVIGNHDRIHRLRSEERSDGGIPRPSFQCQRRIWILEHRQIVGI